MLRPTVMKRRTDEVLVVIARQLSDDFRRYAWALLCEAVSCLRITIPGGPSPDDGPESDSRRAPRAANDQLVEPAPRASTARQLARVNATSAE